jgi:hypothetical protein
LIGSCCWVSPAAPRANFESSGNDGHGSGRQSEVIRRRFGCEEYIRAFRCSANYCVLIMQYFPHYRGWGGWL